MSSSICHAHAVLISWRKFSFVCMQEKSRKTKNWKWRNHCLCYHGGDNTITCIWKLNCFHATSLQKWANYCKICLNDWREFQRLPKLKDIDWMDVPYCLFSIIMKQGIGLSFCLLFKLICVIRRKTFISKHLSIPCMCS